MLRKVINKKDDLYFTNVRAAQIPSETTVKSSISGNDIYLWYNTAAKREYKRFNGGGCRGSKR